MSKVKASILTLYAAARRVGDFAYTVLRCVMKSFRDFANLNTEENGAKPQENGAAGAENGVVGAGAGGAGAAREGTVTAETLAKQIAAAYRGKSDRAVLADIVSSAEKGKRAGTLTNAEIDAFYKRFAPMLNFVQRKKLEQIIAQLKNI